MASRFDDVTITGTLKCNEDAISPQTRASILKQTPLAVFPIPFGDLREYNAFNTVLPSAATGAHLGLIGGTFGTAPPLVQAGDLKAAGATSRYARVLVSVPGFYDAAETLSIVLSAGMKTTVADTSCVVDIECYRVDKISGISADLCATAAQSINSLVFASKTFSITASTLSAGDVLDVRITITCTDAATATAVTPTIAGADLVCDVK